MQNRGTCCLKKRFHTERLRGILVRDNLKRINNENVFLSEDSLMHYKGRLSNYLFQLFLKLKGRLEENSSYFSNAQPSTNTCTLDAYIK